MKKIWKKLRKKSVEAFTLVEMLIVLLIIGVLMLLFVPNLSKQKDVVHEKGDAAVVKVVESQKELYEVKTGKEATIKDLVKEGFISQEQAQTYNEAKKQNP
ncbi:competence type IV pilus major pilin ComGC [Streptococcus ruminicola]|uniref:competence type IV pilus major pilin ComGC n=1 Tax=Streptococcus ruminicola TaxID=2686210 RepID=UPI0012FBDC85|nr:competence type IV pilus major pilin ComGC [Streptococcus ruminicola]QGW99919.1 prepilin-type N-terminal cleavage/methylation domain-containing protein [Streptococcus ruminicola]WFM81626.1 competence type IV pilus major pilin ComGC [Streptococcus ruminicola]